MRTFVKKYADIANFRLSNGQAKMEICKYKTTKF